MQHEDGIGLVRDARQILEVRVRPVRRRQVSVVRAGEADIASAIARTRAAIETTGGAVYQPFLHELSALHALARGAADVAGRERHEATRLWNDMGAAGHIQRMESEIDDFERVIRVASVGPEIVPGTSESDDSRD